MEDRWAALRGDTFRQYGKFSWLLAVKGAVSRRTFRVVFIMRLCQAVARAGGMSRVMLPLCQLMHRWATNNAAMDLSWRTQVGTGLALTHGWGLVVNEGATIGNNVTLFHGVTIGRRDRITQDGERETGYPVIEDEVWVGPQATIVGGITIGRGSRIAGGAFVTSDVPAHSVVVGNPAQIAKSDAARDVMNPAPL